MKATMKIDTMMIHGGIDGDAHTGAVSVPIYQTSTYAFKDFHSHRGYDYSRAKNPTREALEELIADLEGGKRGFAFASGMAAITAVFMLLKAGDKVLMSNNVYGGTYRLLDQVLKPLGISYEPVDFNQEGALEEAYDASVKAIFLETPTNPLLDITDISKVAVFAKTHELLFIVDNTFMTPYLQNPLALGADVVVHSGTKYLGGHSDLIAGLAVANDHALTERLYLIQKSTGGVLNPFDAWLLIRGIKTLAVRMQRHQENAHQIALFLSQHQAVDKLYYPGLHDHPGHSIQRQQARGFGAMLAFSLKPAYAIEAFVSHLKLVTFGESLGGVESLLSHPATMTHGSIPKDIRERAGITDNLLRLSVGIEAVEDLIHELTFVIEYSQG